MKIIEFKNDSSQKSTFDFFNRMTNPHFNICANVDITKYLDRIKQEQVPFTPAMVYATSKAANDIPVFRQRIRGGTGRGA